VPNGIENDRVSLMIRITEQIEIGDVGYGIADIWVSSAGEYQR
jgi:hypothetical protein